MSLPEKHYTATVYVLSDTTPRKALLLHHRKHDKWVPPGGHQELHENPVEAAIREVQEETGVDITAYIESSKPSTEQAHYLPLPSYMMEQRIPVYGDEPEHYHIDMEYMVRLPEQSAVHSQDESHDIGWFTLEQLADLDTWDDVRAVLQRELAS